MMFPAPRNEARRLAELHGLAILDAPSEPALERIVRLAARHFDMPMAAITFVDEYRVRFQVVSGLPVHDATREGACCTHAILRKDVLVVDDVGADPRFARRPLGVETDNVRFYAGAPLWTEDGCALGVLCVMDTATRKFTREEEEILMGMAASVMDRIALRKTTAELGNEMGRRQRAERSLAHHDRLLRRLSQTQDELLHHRLLESTKFDESLRTENAVLRLAREEAEKANTAKSDFLMRMSHELRTPLNAILGFGQILQGTAAAEAQRDCATHVVTAGRHLLSLINEVLDIARIEAGRLDLSLEPVSIPEIVGEALALIGPLAAERRIALAVRGRADAGPATVLADRQRLKQVLLNLLSNAVKYSPEGGRVAVHWRAERGGTLRFCVSDEGPGITRDQAARLFVAFERLGAEGSDIPGTGLGLALSRRLVEAMRGKIGARVGQGRGSTFWVRLPRWQEDVRPALPIFPILPVA